ncbi:hypothetical protein [Halorubrum vacuolatum]|uniref:Uncharacterized protein n=1 Tax=Halorubrum vacuolatum TaxID=63740 RepID=A0A238XNC5_HALVU|nr:hypothetical protein [Halorubrum vacuolatum]SNR60200.1 hypothetical protein SAMN06264855_12023 [Halorubrum vacuolatum]
MDRRAYLGVVAAGVLAGCGDIDPPAEDTDDGADPADDEDTPPEEPADDEATPDDEEEPADDEAEHDDADEPELTEDERVALERLEEGDSLLGEALELYAESGNADSFLDVRASATRFRWVPIARSVREANDRFDRAAEPANSDQRARIDDLRDVGEFIRESARTQAKVGPAFEAFREVLIAHQGDSISTVTWNRFQDRVEAADERMESLSSVSDPEVADASEQLTVEEYAGKVDQLAAERDALVAVADERRPFTEGHRAWIDAERAYRSRSWSRAAREFERATDRFESVAERLERDPVDHEPFDRVYQTFRTIAGTLADAAIEYEASARAYEQWARGRNRAENREEGDERRRAGRRILRDEDVVTDIPSVRRLENYEGP